MSWKKILPRLSLVLALSMIHGLALGADRLLPPPVPEKMEASERAVVIATFEESLEESMPLAVGDSEEVLLKRLGHPDGTLAVGDRKRLAYDEGSVMVENGKILSLTNLSPERLRSPDAEAYAAYQRALGKVHYMGRWMTPDEAEAAFVRAAQARELTRDRIQVGNKQKATRARQMSSDTVTDIRQNGARIGKEDLVVPGQVTVVDFYADWCKPCKMIAPYLDKLAEDPAVSVRKVDIVNWKSPVAQQWELRSIPNMRVYDRQGNQVGEATHDFNLIMRNVQAAKQR